MDSEALKTFVTVHREGGFSNAAAALNRSQPAISRRIALLEEELGAPLFERVAGGVTLSAAGRQLLAHAERALAALGDASAAIAALKNKGAGSVALALVGTLAGSTLTPVLKRFAAEHPQVDLTISTATSAGVSGLVRSGEATIGLRYLDDASPDLDCKEIAAETLCVVCASDHQRANEKVNSLKLLRHERWFAFPSAWENRETHAGNVFAQFRACGVAEILCSSVDSLTAQKRLIEAGFGLALLPESAIEEEVRDGSLAIIAVEGLRLANPICRLVRKGGYLAPAAQHLLDALEERPQVSARKLRRS